MMLTKKTFAMLPALLLFASCSKLQVQDIVNDQNTVRSERNADKTIEVEGKSVRVMSQSVFKSETQIEAGSIASCD